jgi:hypothetical protein
LVRRASEAAADAQPFIDSLSHLGAPAVPEILRRAGSRAAREVDRRALEYPMSQEYGRRGCACPPRCREERKAISATGRRARPRRDRRRGDRGRICAARVEKEPEPHVRAAVLQAIIATRAEPKRTLARIDAALDDSSRLSAPPPSSCSRATARSCVPLSRRSLPL